MRVQDDIQVVQVRVEIMNETGTVLEAGGATEAGAGTSVNRQPKQNPSFSRSIRRGRGTRFTPGPVEGSGRSGGPMSLVFRRGVFTMR
jgi:hypothetical protein